MKTAEDLEKDNEILKLKLKISELEKELELVLNSGYKKINTF